MPIRLQSPHRQAGLSLLEVLIATVVLSAGLLGLAGLQIAGMKTTHNSYQMQQATWMGHDLLERMRANKESAKNEAYVIDSSSTDYCANRTGPDVDCRTTECDGTNMAAYDIYQIMCGVGAGSGINNVLIGGRLQVVCENGDCGDRVRITLQWDERNSAQQGTDFDGGNDGIETFTYSPPAMH
ncbi:MAG: type IV pilus modification protein PilV [Thiothrix sp.]